MPEKEHIEMEGKERTSETVKVNSETDVKVSRRQLIGVNKQ